MTDNEKRLIQMMLDEGNIIRTSEYVIDGKQNTQYAVEYEGETYHITKHNGEIVYLHRVIQ